MNEFSISGFTGKSNIEAMKRKYPLRPVMAGETLITFGTFKGWTVEYVNEFDHNYIVFLASIASNPYFLYHPESKKIIDRAIQLTKQKEIDRRKKILEFRKDKHHETGWLYNFVNRFEKDHPEKYREIRFLRSIMMQIMRQNRIDLITKKQLFVLGDIWNGHYGNKRELIKKLKPYWVRKYDRLEEVLANHEKT